MTDDDGKILDLYQGHVDWVGDQCQFQDISIVFHIVFWTSLVLLVFVVLGVYLLCGATSESQLAGTFSKQKLQ
jgi:hypothetical protein